MKKILFIVIAILALSIVVFGFSAGRSARSVNEITAKQAVRFNIEPTLPARVHLSAQVRIMHNATGALAYDGLISLTLKGSRYVSEPILLNQGNYRVEAIIIMPDGKRMRFTNMHELVLNGISLGFH